MLPEKAGKPAPKKFTLLTLLLITIIFMCLSAGCAHKPDQEKTAEQLSEEGMNEFEEGHYRKAIEAFENLQDWYPFSQYATLADLKIPDAHFEMKEYDSAVSAYETFEKLHPRNEALPFVIYRIGLCHFKQLDTIDRDQSPAENAIEAFTRLRRKFPDSEYSAKAGELIERCRQSLADHHLYVGKFYYKSKHYQAAQNRFEKVVREYEDVGDVETAREYLHKCRQELAEEKTIVPDPADAPGDETEASEDEEKD